MNDRSHRVHQPVLDGIRGIAIIAVLLTHGVTLNHHFEGGVLSRMAAYLFTPGWAGVDLFFVLSGFLITGILLSTKGAENYLASFYVRRLLRIAPLYYLMLIALLVAGSYSYWVAARLPSSPFRLTYFVYLQNIPVFLFNGKLGGLLAHFWSLAVEEQFYLVWPFLVLVLPERYLFYLCGAGVLVALPLRTYLVAQHPGDFRVMMFTTSRVDGLLIGSACATYMSVAGRPVPWRYIAVMAGVGAAIIGYIALFHHGEFLGTAFYMPTIGITGFSLLSGALVAASQYPVRLMRACLDVRWLQAFGKYSYGIYVYHVLVYSLGQSALEQSGAPSRLSFGADILYLAAMIGITFGVAKISYDYFEARILSWKHNFAPRYSEATIPTLAMR